MNDNLATAWNQANRHIRTKRFVMLLWVILLGLLSANLAKAEDLQQPQLVIQNVSDQLRQKLQDTAFTKDFAQVVRFVNNLIEPHTDFEKIAPLVLGSHWKMATATEQKRFQQEFQTLLVRIYSRAFVEYKDWSIRFMPLKMIDDASKVTVITEVLQPHEQPVQVNYRMFLSNGNWKVYDIVIAGMSLVTTYRSTFNDEIKTKGSISAVIDALVKRNNEALAAKGS